MSERAWRWSAAAGAVGITLVLAALFLPGAPPKTSDSVAQLTSTFIAKRRLFLVDTYLVALGALAFFWSLAPLHDFLSRGRRGRGLATLAVLGGAVAMLLILVGVAITSGLVLNAAGMGDPALVRAFADTSNVLIELSKFGLATMVLATVAATAGAATLPGRARVAGLAAAGLLIASALPPLLFDRGILQFGGGVEVLGALPAAIWLAWLSFFVARAGSSSGAEASR